MTVIQFGNRVESIRQMFGLVYETWLEEGSPEGVMLELLGASFVADSDTIFGKVNHAYIAREIAWYDSQSLYVNDIPGGPPKIWAQVADADGLINSNYGHLIYGNDEGGNSQYNFAVAKLKEDKATRQAVMIYTRPTIHEEWDSAGGHDFICTNAVHYTIRDDKLYVVVQMRSNDAIFGYRNDYAWQKVVQLRVLRDLEDTYPNLEPGDIVWQAASLHIYPRHFDLVKRFIETGDYRVDL